MCTGKPKVFLRMATAPPHELVRHTRTTMFEPCTKHHCTARANGKAHLSFAELHCAETLFPSDMAKVLLQEVQHLSQAKDGLYRFRCHLRERRLFHGPFHPNTDSLPGALSHPFESDPPHQMADRFVFEQRCYDEDLLDFVRVCLPTAKE